MEGLSGPEYNEEFRRFTADKRNFKDALIVLSTGPYEIAVILEEQKESIWN